MIARGGQVYGFPLTLGSVIESRGLPRPRLLGIRKASTLGIFCSKHDNLLFADIEKEPIMSSERHAFLLAYRAISQVLFAKQGAMSLESSMSTLDAGLNDFGQVRFQSEFRHHFEGFAIGLREVRERKARYDAMLMNGDYSDIRFCVIWFDSIPDILCSAGKNPTYDFEGRELQDLSRSDLYAQSLTFTLATSGRIGGAYFAWLRHENQACEKLMSSLLTQPRDRISDAIVRFAFSGIENLYWRPDWWDKLDEDLQKLLHNRFVEAIHPRLPVRCDHLCDDGAKLVEWRVKTVDTNVDSLREAAVRVGSS